jgi:branched-chain amino acid transport system ATP-binding protein
MNPSEGDAMLSVDRINTFYGETQALFDVSLHMNQGEVVSLLGASGAGKTTTLRSILGLTPPKTGHITFRGEDVTRKPTHTIARRGISWVPDDRRIFPTLTVARNLELGQKKTGFRAWNIQEMFSIFSALEYLMHRDCENLSGGEMQMVAIARAMLGSPGLILFDEPTQGLAPKVVYDVMATIRKLKAEGISVLMVEQHTQLALSVSDRVYVIDRGALVFAGTPDELSETKEIRRALLGI